MSDITGVIFDIKKYSIHDGPGIRTTVFFKGCPLHCWWCHNPESQSAEPELMLRPNRCVHCGVCMEVCPSGAISGSIEGEQGVFVPITDRSKCEVNGRCAEVCYSGAREIVGKRMTVSEVMAEIERDKVFYDQSGGGVTFSGGEPLVQPNFLSDLLHACRTEDIHTTLDTCGYANWRIWRKFVGLVDLFLYDVKLMSDARHRKYTGVPNRLILSNLRRLSVLGAKIIVRIPLVPEINDDETNLRMTCDFLASLANTHEVEFIAYHTAAKPKYESLGYDYQLPGVKPPTQEELERVISLFESYGLCVINRSLVQQGVSEVNHDNERESKVFAPAVIAGS